MSTIKQHFRQTQRGPVLVRQHEDKRIKHGEQPGDKRGNGKAKTYPDRKSFVNISHMSSKLRPVICSLLYSNV